MQYAILECPVGFITVQTTDDGEVTAVGMHENPTPGEGEVDGQATKEAVKQLREYFAGARREFDLPLAPTGTDFQRRVWQALSEIPYGATRSYVDIARDIGRPTASRAVGAANGRNPISIVVPCHRVIGASGKLVGYAGGMERKRWLLAHEQGLETLRT